MERQAGIKALLDSGATDNFISPMIIERFGIPTYKLSQTRIIRNVDGTPNSLGGVSEATTLKVNHNGNETTQCFFVINLGSDDMLLGMPFLAATNPQINWSEGSFEGSVIAYTDDAHKWTPQRQRYLSNEMAKAQQDWSDDEPGPERYIPTNERGVITYPYIYSRATKATELAIQAIDKTEKTWQEQVPLEYHLYGKVFSDKEASRFPQSRPWDHAIELLPDAP